MDFPFADGYTAAPGRDVVDHASHVGKLATEIFGLYGQVEKSKWSPMGGSMISLYQHSIGSTICAGSNEIQRNIIAWVGLELPRFK